MRLVFGSYLLETALAINLDDNTVGICDSLGGQRRLFGWDLGGHSTELLNQETSRSAIVSVSEFQNIGAAAANNRPHPMFCSSSQI